jgi:hypothetical protein
MDKIQQLSNSEWINLVNFLYVNCSDLYEVQNKKFWEDCVMSTFLIIFPVYGKVFKG